MASTSGKTLQREYQTAPNFPVIGQRILHSLSCQKRYSPRACHGSSHNTRHSGIMISLVLAYRFAYLKTKQGASKDFTPFPTFFPVYGHKKSPVACATGRATLQEASP